MYLHLRTAWIWWIVANFFSLFTLRVLRVCSCAASHGSSECPVDLVQWNLDGTGSTALFRWLLRMERMGINLEVNYQIGITALR